VNIGKLIMTRSSSTFSFGFVPVFKHLVLIRVNSWIDFHIFMQNEPNFPTPKMQLSHYRSSAYIKSTFLSKPKNEPKRTQFKPNFWLIKPNSNPIQSRIRAINVSLGKMRLRIGAELAEEVKQVVHIIGQGGFEFHDLAGCGVFEFDGRCVQGAAGDDRLFDGGGGVFELPGIYELAAVHIVADDGVLDVRKVDANLMGAAGFREAFDERIAAELLEHLVEGDGLFADFRPDCIFFPDLRVDAERRGDFVGGQVGRAVDDGEVFFFDGAVLELPCDLPLRDVVFGDDHNAGGVAVEAMDDAGSEFAQAGRQLAGIMSQGIDQRSVSVAAGWMDDEVGGLVDDNQIVVLINDVERHLFGRNLLRGQFGQCHLNDVAGVEDEAGLDDLAVDFDGAGGDLSLEHCAAEVCEPVVEVLIDAPRFDGSSDLESQRLVLCGFFCHYYCWGRLGAAGGLAGAGAAGALAWPGAALPSISGTSTGGCSAGFGAGGALKTAIFS
jgi:hypothetical protein